MCIMVRKPLSLERQQDAQRLKSVWESFKNSSKSNGKKVTQEDVSDACGWNTQGAFSAYLNGRTPLNLDALTKLSNYFGVPANEISPSLAATLESAIIENNQNTNIRITSLDGLKRVPVLTYVQAGSWREAIQMPSDNYVFVSVNVSENSFGAYVVGDSMSPEFKDGDLIIIDTEVTPVPTDCVMAEDQNGITFKKYRSRGINEEGVEVFDLVPLNPDYPTIRSDRSKVKIIGVVVEHRRILKKKNRSY